jgi:type I restriction enzyme S subunit
LHNLQTDAYVSSVEIKERSINEQKLICATLDKVADLISLRKLQLSKLDELIKSRFIEMFGDPVTNPKKWICGTIRDVVKEVKYGTSRPAVDNGKYPYLRMNNITYEGHLDLSNIKYIDIPDNEVEKCIARKDDILFNRTNSKELVGKTCVYELDKPMIIAGYIIRVRVNQKVLPIYLSTVLNSKYGKNTLFDMCKAIVGQANINAQELQNIKILIPPIKLQNEFAAFVEQVDKSKFEIQKSLEKLEMLKKSLMQQYFG